MMLFQHIIRDELDYQRHMDWVNVNLLKHGLVKRIIDWASSTFHQYFEQGIYSANWYGDVDILVSGDE